MSAFTQRGSVEARFLTADPGDELAITLAEYNAGTDVIHGDAASAECLQEYDGLTTTQETIEYGDACSLDDKTIKGRRVLGVGILRYVMDTATNTIRTFWAGLPSGRLVVVPTGNIAAGEPYTVINCSPLQEPETLFSLALQPSRYEVQLSKTGQKQGVLAA